MGVGRLHANPPPVPTPVGQADSSREERTGLDESKAESTTPTLEPLRQATPIGAGP